MSQKLTIQVLFLDCNHCDIRLQPLVIEHRNVKDSTRDYSLDIYTSGDTFPPIFATFLGGNNGFSCVSDV